MHSYICSSLITHCFCDVLHFIIVVHVTMPLWQWNIQYPCQYIRLILLFHGLSCYLVVYLACDPCLWSLLMLFVAVLSGCLSDFLQSGCPAVTWLTYFSCCIPVCGSSIFSHSPCFRTSFWTKSHINRWVIAPITGCLNPYKIKEALVRLNHRCSIICTLYYIPCIWSSLFHHWVSALLVPRQNIIVCL